MRRWFRNCRRGIANIVRWTPLVWRDFDFDYTPLLEIMQFKLCKMADAHEQHGCCVHRKRSAQQMRLCAELCRRIHEDNYSELFGSKVGRRLAGPAYAGRYRFQNSALEGFLAQRDIKLLTYMLRKHLTKWWD